MIPVPAYYITAADRTHAPLWRCDILDAAGAPLLPDLPITAGEITKDGNATPRTSADIVVPISGAPMPLDRAYLPTGTRILLQYRIAEYTDWVTVADLDQTQSDLERPNSVWRLRASDRAIRIAKDDTSRGAWTQPNGTIGAAITAIVRRTFPGTAVQVSGPAATQAVPAGTNMSGDPWRAAVTLAEQAGSEVFYAADRSVVVRPVPTLGTPVDTIAVGPAGSITGYRLRHEMGYNTATITYRNKADRDQIIVGRAVDDRPGSPVRVSLIGSHVVIAESRDTDAAPTQAEADAAAAALLATAGGRARAPELDHVARPWLEPGDTVTVSYAGGVSETQLVQSVRIPIHGTNVQTTRLRSTEYRMENPA